MKEKGNNKENPRKDIEPELKKSRMKQKEMLLSDVCRAYISSEKTQRHRKSPKAYSRIRHTETLSASD
jgi:hypothetical protein